MSRRCEKRIWARSHGEIQYSEQRLVTLDPTSDLPVRRTGDAVEIAGDYQHRARSKGFVVQRFWHAEKERMIREFSAPQRGERVLDVGCGSGVITDVLASSGASTTGVDGNLRAIDYARRTFVRDGLDFRCALVEDLGEAPGSVDRIYCLEVIEHLYEPQVHELFRQMHALVKVGGTLTLTTPNFRGLWPAVELVLDTLRLVPHLAGDQHVSKFNRRSLRSALERAGWKVERLVTFSTFAPFLSVFGWKPALWVAERETSWSLPFGNVLFTIAKKE